MLDGARSDFEVFKNHTSVLFWSLGNEPYAGDDIAACMWILPRQKFMVTKAWIIAKNESSSDVKNRCDRWKK